MVVIGIDPKNAKRFEKNLMNVILNEKSGEDELRAWFELMLDLRVRGFTPEEVRATVCCKNPSEKKSTAEIAEELQKLEIKEENKSWCW